MTIANIQPTRILLVDDHSVVRTGLRLLIEQRRHLQVIGEAETAGAALDFLRKHPTDMVILDLDLGGENGMESIPAIRQFAGNVRIVVLTGITDKATQLRAVQLGAVGLIQKSHSADTLLHAIERVSLGEVWFASDLVAAMLSDISRSAKGEENPLRTRISQLTEREREVITLISEGLQNRAIGERLSITETTVRHHLTSIFSKVGVANRLELVIFAYRNGLATIE